MSHLLKSVVVSCAVLVLATSVFAEIARPDEKTQALLVVKKYAEATACDTTFDKDAVPRTTLKDVFKIRWDVETGEATYYVLWNGDTGCAGGSGTNSAYLSEVSRTGSNRPLLVINPDVLADLAGSEAGTINPRFIEQLSFPAKNSMIIIASNFADDKFGGKPDSNNFPANKFKYTLNYDVQEGKWKLVQQVLLQRNN